MVIKEKINWRTFILARKSSEGSLKMSLLGVLAKICCVIYL